MPIHYESRKTLESEDTIRWRNTYFVRNGEKWHYERGNAGGTILTCDNCNEEIDEGVYIGKDLDDEYRTAMACIKCLQEGINTITNKGKNNE
ncbi:MAG: hypothetical protein ACR2PH_07910 [Desulfobulbia bacterium]